MYIKNRMLIACVMFIGLPVSLQGMKFIKTIKTKREELEKQIIVLTKAGDELLLNGTRLREELVNKVINEQKDLSTKQEPLKIPYSIIVEPFKFFEAELKKEALKKANDPVAVNFYDNLITIIRGELFQKTYNGIFTLSLQTLKIPTLPDVLKNLMALLNKVDVTMGSIKAKFDPIVLDLCSYVDIEKAKAALGLPANSGLFTKGVKKINDVDTIVDVSVNLEFVNKYRDYVNKVYAEINGGGKFDARGIYSGLWKAIENFKNAVIKMKNIEEFFAGMKF